MAKLVLRLPDGTTREYALDRERMTIGRRADNDICLPFPAVSGEHAAVVTILDDSFLEDLNSTNGTLVNGKRITKHFLRDHDEIDIGRHLLVYVTGEYLGAEYRPLPEGMDMVAVTTNGGATIGDDERTLVPPPREPRRARRESASSRSEEGDNASNPGEFAELDALDARLTGTEDRGTAEERSEFPNRGASDTSGSDDIAAEPVQSDIAERAQEQRSNTPTHDETGVRVDTSEAEARAVESARATTPTIEVLDGPRAGGRFDLVKDEFIVGRPGVTIAAIRRTNDRHHLVHLEGGLRPRVNGVDVAEAGQPLASGDEIEIAQTRLRYRAAL